MKNGLTTAKALIDYLKADGWFLTHVNGSHHYMRHSVKPNLVMVPANRKSRGIGPALLNVVLKKAGLK